MKTTYKNFMISDSFIGEKPATWNFNNCNYHKVTVKNTDNGRRTSFDFWCSISKPDFEDENDLLNAFYCFLSDAEAGTYNLDEFYNEFYGNGQIEEAMKAHKGCKNALRKFDRLTDNADLWDLLNELSEIAG